MLDCPLWLGRDEGFQCLTVLALSPGRFEQPLWPLIFQGSPEIVLTVRVDCFALHQQVQPASRHKLEANWLRRSFSNKTFGLFNELVQILVGKVFRLMGDPYEVQSKVLIPRVCQFQDIFPVLPKFKSGT